MRWPSHRVSQAGSPVRHPIDVLGDESGRGRPRVFVAGRAVAEFAGDRDRAVLVGDFSGRANALWGLIELGSPSLSWCETALRSSDPEMLEDAAAVLAWVGTPERLVRIVLDLIARLDDGQVTDALRLALPTAVASELSGDAPETSGSETAGVLLGGARDPFTKIIYFVRAPYERVLADRGTWDSEQRWRRGLSEHSGSLREALDLLEPCSIPSWKVLYVETTAEWTAVFSQGSDLSYVSHYGERLKTLVVRTSHSPHVVRNGEVLRYGDTSMELTDGSRADLAPLYGLRSIQASRQGSKWEWELHGEPQPFEDFGRYERRMVRERFDLPMLNAYCRAVGIKRDDPGFYGPRATLEVRDTSRWPREPIGLPSAEWRRRHS